jgi:hypothetical protein
MPFKFNDIWKFTTKYITTNKKVTIGINETVVPNDNYTLNVTHNNNNKLALFNSDKIYEDNLPLNQKYVSKFNKDKNKNITITNSIINTNDFINIDDDTLPLNISNIEYTMGELANNTQIKFNKRNNYYFNDSLYLLYKFDISPTNTYNDDITTFLEPISLNTINTNFDQHIDTLDTLGVDNTTDYVFITNNINDLQVRNLIDNIDIFTKEDFYDFQGDKYIIGNSSLTLNNKFMLYNEFEYKNKVNNLSLNDHFNLRRLFPYITISFWFYIKNENYDLILFNIVDNGRIDNKAHNSIYYENKELKYKKHNKDDFNTHFINITISNNISINKWYHLSIISHNDSKKSFMDQDVYNNYNPKYYYSDFSLSNNGSEYKLPQSNKTYFILDGILQRTVNTYLFDEFSDTNNFICFGSFIKSDNTINIIDQTPHNGTLVKYGYIDDFRMYNTILSPKLIQKKLIGDILFINNKSINTIGNTGLIFTSFEEKLEIGNNQNNDYKLIVCGEIQSKNIKINNSNINTGSLLVFDDNCNITSLNQNNIKLELNLGNNSIGQIRISNKILEMINIDSFQFKLNNNFIFRDESIGEPIFSYSNQQFKFNKTVHFEDDTTNGSGSGSDNINNGLIINGTLNTEQIQANYSGVLNFKTEIGLIVDNNQYINKELLVKEDITAFFQASDKRLKNNIKPLSKSINLIKKLKPVTFKWKKDIFNKNMSNKKDVGFIAQELEEILPLCVKNVNINNDSYKYLKHERIIPYLVNTIQELIERVEYLEKKI